VIFRDDYLLSTSTGLEIYAHIADLPIVDAHSHVEAYQIAENRGWSDIWEAEGATDHYVWELMRRLGVPEERITGNASNREKWFALAEIFPLCAGNPVYDWIHLDLSRRFGIEELLGPDTAEAIWNRTKEKLSRPEMHPRQLLRDMKVEILATTDPVGADLRPHHRLAEEFSGAKVVPTWRPDALLRVGAGGWKETVQQLGEKYGIDVSSLRGLLDALERDHDEFGRHGCRISDHALQEADLHLVSDARASRAYARAVAGKEISPQDIVDLRSYLMHFFAELDAAAGWVMQLHIGAVRDYRDALFFTLGRDSGGDVTDHDLPLVQGISDFLNRFDGRLTVVLYVLHPAHAYTATVLVRAFPGVYLGAPWWFMDNPYHMREYLELIANVDLLSLFAGMVTDSRKILSYESRTIIFRRVLADTLGKMVEQGRMPSSVALKLAEHLSYHRPKELFFSHLS